MALPLFLASVVMMVLACSSEIKVGQASASFQFSPQPTPTPESWEWRDEFTVAAGRSVCAPIPLQEGNRVEGQFTVAGGSGDDVNFAVLDPGGVELQRRDRARARQDFQFRASRSGEWCLRFDNSFSYSAVKGVAIWYRVHWQ